VPTTAFYPPGQIAPQVADYLQNPTEIRQDLTDLIAKATIADYVFAQGPANNGAVVYDEVTGRSEGEREAEVIAPGAEFPIIDDEQVTPRTAKVDKYGGAAPVTWESRDWNEWDVVQRQLRILRSKVITKVNRVSVAALTRNQNLRSYGASSWGSTGSDPVGDIMRGTSLVESDEDFPYQANVALVNPLDKQEFLLSRDIRDQFPRETRELNPALSGDIDGIAGLEWIVSSAVPVGTIYAMERMVVGSVRDAANGVQTNVYPDNDRQRDIIQAWRHIVPIITDPLAAVRITGFRS